ncbi:MAG TPA: Wzt carbohydrate-binding domain-containing protein [Bryobacteraceae bacterium]|nr:Wzt carbohydrate-binding domain-containing protein [Bryobacteraceae bacterium]
MKVDFGGEPHDLPAGAVIGLIGDGDSRAETLLEVAARATAIPYTLDNRDQVERVQAAIAIEEQRRSGKTVLLTSHDPALLQWLSDEVWWVHAGRVRQKGDPRVVLDSYSRHINERLRKLAGPVLVPALRRGDGRAELIGLEAPGTVVSGETADIVVRVRFAADVADPVVGIMIRTRIGMEVYGTNTELEGIKLGPCKAGDTLSVRFAFKCDLCPQVYTLTAASHDPDGVWHDWHEDAVAFMVGGTRYTAGVANLRAAVTCSRE